MRAFTECGAGAYEFEPCSAVSDRTCATCSSNPTGIVAEMIDRNDPQAISCSDADPFCISTIDVLVLYTPAYKAILNDDLDAVIQSANHAVNTANEALKQSLISPEKRFRLVAVEEFPYEERDDLKGDLMWFRNNPHYQATRRAHAADVGVVLFGTAGFGGLAYSNYATTTAFVERGVLVIDGTYLLPDFDDCYKAMNTVGHELGHILGAGHRASQYMSPNGTAYGYHNQEPLYRRNEAYGLSVSQHDQKLYTLMSYANHKNANNTNVACFDCVQYNAFSSPELWFVFEPTDPLYGSCLVIDDSDSTAIQLHCDVDDAWVLMEEEYVVNPNAVVTWTASAAQRHSHGG